MPQDIFFSLETTNANLVTKIKNRMLQLLPIHVSSQPIYYNFPYTLRKVYVSTLQSMHLNTGKTDEPVIVRTDKESVTRIIQAKQLTSNLWNALDYVLAKIREQKLNFSGIN